MLIPKRTKHRKYQKGKIKGIITRKSSSGLGITEGMSLSFGQYGLKALEHGRVTSAVLEAARRTMNRHIKRYKGGKIFIRVFPHIPFTAKPTEVRMGKGKGSISYWAARVKKGQILFELDRVPIRMAHQAFYKASQKLPILTRFVPGFNSFSV